MSRKYLNILSDTEFFENVGKDELVILVYVDEPEKPDLFYYFSFSYFTQILYESKLPEGSKFLGLKSEVDRHWKYFIDMPANTKVYQSKEVLRILESKCPK